jgi:hypothetical protein
MVSDSGQLLTMEGVAAGILMLTTAYLVLSTTSVYTPAETHISDLQLAQLGTDALLVMDTPYHSGNLSELENYIESNDAVTFRERFRTLVTANGIQQINFKGQIFYRNRTTNPSGTYSINFGNSTSMFNITNRERMVKVSRLVLIKYNSTYPLFSNPNIDPRNQIVLLEVSLWRS